LDCIGADINLSGQIIGNGLRPGDTEERGFLYSEGAFFELSDLIDARLGWEIVAAMGINDAGQIAATGCRRYSGTCRALRLDPRGSSPVPEPGTLGLLGMGLVGFAIGRRREVRSRPTRTDAACV
ncbi:MAG: PEP-CTERM sorting domain-containing protein, partial [Lysobacterales bacterium]